MKLGTDIETQAAEWLVRRDRGTAEPAERHAFEQWLAADARHRHAYLELQKSWAQADRLKRWVPHQGVMNPAVLKNYATARDRGRRWWLPASAAAAVLFLSAGLFLLGPAFMPGTYATAVGGYQRIVLDDGSVLQLNTDSRAKVRFTAEQRSVTLLKGEGVFQIEKDPSRPFVVHAADKTIRALGTAFSVRIHDCAVAAFRSHSMDCGERNGSARSTPASSVEVTVTEGKVSVGAVGGAERVAGQTASAGRGVVEMPGAVALTTNQSAWLTAGAVSVHDLAAGETGRRLAWKTGELSFQGESLEAVAVEFNRYNRRQILLADPRIATLRIGGNFQATDLDSFIAAMQRSFDVRATVEGDTVRLSR